MKIKWKKQISSIILTTLMVCQLGTVAVKADGYVCGHGYSTFGDYKMMNGVGNYGSYNRYYWVDGNFSYLYGTYIDSAVNEWVYTTSSMGVSTPISIGRT